MIPQPATDEQASSIKAVHSAAVLVAIVISIVAIVIGGDGTVPTWLGLVVTVLVGLITAFSVRWYRRRPVEIGDWRSYRDTVLVRGAIAIDPAIVGGVMAFVGRSVWPAAVGGVMSIVNAALAPASGEDYERHQIIFIEQAAEVPEESWGTADPDAEAPWETLEEGHGHGLSH